MHRSKHCYSVSERGQRNGSSDYRWRMFANAFPSNDGCPGDGHDRDFEEGCTSRRRRTSCGPAIATRQPVHKVISAKPKKKIGP